MTFLILNRLSGHTFRAHYQHTFKTNCVLSTTLLAPSVPSCPPTVAQNVKVGLPHTLQPITADSHPPVWRGTKRPITVTPAKTVPSTLSAQRIKVTHKCLVVGGKVGRNLCFLQTKCLQMRVICSRACGKIVKIQYWYKSGGWL